MIQQAKKTLTILYFISVTDELLNSLVTSATTPVTEGPSTTTMVPVTCPPFTITYSRVVDTSAYYSEGINSLVPPFPPESSPPEESTAKVMERCDHFDVWRSVPPVYDKPIDIQVVLLVRNLVGIDNVNEIMSVNGYLFQSWKVSTCPYNSSTVELKTVRSEVYVNDPSLIWIPKLRFISAENSNIYMSELENGDDLVVSLTNETGSQENRTFNFYWTREGLFSTECSLDLHNFPFDSQTCTYTYALVRSDSVVKFSEPLLLWENGSSHSEWTVTGFNTKLGSEFFKGYNVSIVQFSVSLSRIADYYVHNLIIPVASLTVLALATFFMPPDRPDRSLLSLTILLALTVIQSQVQSNVPKKSESILLNDFTQLCTGIAALICFYEIFVLFIYRGLMTPQQLLRHLVQKEFCNKKLTMIRFFDMLILAGFTVAFVLVILYLVQTADYAIFKSTPSSMSNMWIWI